MTFIPIYQPFYNGNESTYVSQCFESGWISSKGKFVAEFENQFSNYLGDVSSTSVCNGTAALHLALHALGITSNDEVIVPSFTYIATVNAIRYVGATPIFIDVDPNTWNIDVNHLPNLVTSRTKAVLAVHIYGAACDMPELTRFCNVNNLFLIEDVAEALGSSYDDKKLGTFGDISTFSFFGNKTLTTGEGGMVVSKNHSIIDYASYLKSHSVSPTKAYWHDELGFNFRMTNICSAIGVAQLESLEFVLLRKRQIFRLYSDLLSNTLVVFQSIPPSSISSYWLVACLFPSSKVRDDVSNIFKSSRIDSRPFFHPAHLMPMYARGSLDLPVSLDISSRGLCLPSYPDLLDEQIHFICSSILSVLS